MSTILKQQRQESKKLRDSARGQPFLAAIMQEKKCQKRKLNFMRIIQK